MAKKKNQSRKHKFKYTEPNQTETLVTAGGSSPALATSRPLRRTADTVRDFSYVSHDLKRITITAVILIFLELILWVALNNTGLGKAVYSLISV